MEITAPTTEELVATVLGRISAMSASRISAPDAREALDTLAARLEAAERIKSADYRRWDEQFSAMTLRAHDAEREVERLREAIQRELGYTHGADTIKRLSAALAEEK
jgi:hypothetical protein